MMNHIYRVVNMQAFRWMRRDHDVVQHDVDKVTHYTIQKQNNKNPHKDSLIPFSSTARVYDSDGSGMGLTCIFGIVMAELQPKFEWCTGNCLKNPEKHSKIWSNM